MADLTYADKKKLERYLEMGGGYVCDFTNTSFEDFVYTTTNIYIYDDKYTKHSGSKANRLRAFWEKESNQIVAKLLEELLEYWKEESPDSTLIIYQQCKEIVEKLKSWNPVESIDNLNPEVSEKDIHQLFESIKDSMLKDKPQEALDRLHTYVIKYIRIICDKHSIKYEKKTPIHSLFGGYIKFLKREGYIESEMSVRILKSSISILEAFNDVRNYQSLAHDNNILNYDEAALIFYNISCTMNFIKRIEKRIYVKLLNNMKAPNSDEAEELFIQFELDRMRGK